MGDRSGGGVRIKNYTVVFFFSSWDDWFVYCFRMSFPEINALSGGGREKKSLTMHRIGWESGDPGLEKIVWAVWRGMNKGNVHMTEFTFFP